MEISEKAKERFCRDCNLPLKIYKEPYFTDRLRLYDKFYGTLNKWDVFLRELEKYHCEQDYFEDYNRVKDAAIFSIKNSEGYQRFNDEDMNQYGIDNKGVSGNDIFKNTNDGRKSISIDIRKANFSCLRYYNPNIFSNAETWEDFINMYTDNKHIIDSKYIRQVILGNCNPKRQITYEKWIMDKILTCLVDVYMPIEKVVFFSNDEIVIDISDMDTENQMRTASDIDIGMKAMAIPLKVELFTLHKIRGTEGYYKEITKKNGEKEFAFKCLNSDMAPFAFRSFLGEQIMDSDRVFYHNGILAQYIEVPQIEVMK